MDNMSNAQPNNMENALYGKMSTVPAATAKDGKRATRQSGNATMDDISTAQRDKTAKSTSW